MAMTGPTAEMSTTACVITVPDLLASLTNALIGGAVVAFVLLGSRAVIRARRHHRFANRRFLRLHRSATTHRPNRIDRTSSHELSSRGPTVLGAEHLSGSSRLAGRRPRSRTSRVP